MREREREKESEREGGKEGGRDRDQAALKLTWRICVALAVVSRRGLCYFCWSEYEGSSSLAGMGSFVPFCASALLPQGRDPAAVQERGREAE